MSRELKPLNEEGFVIIQGGRPFWVCLYHGKPWAMYWNEGSKAWVTAKALTDDQVNNLAPQAIPKKHADIYHVLHCRFVGGQFDWIDPEQLKEPNFEEEFSKLREWVNEKTGK